MHSPQLSGLRWTRLCVASTATALFASTASFSTSASASQTHALRSGESLDSLARTYHVSVQDLIDANHIEDQNRIPDGRLLTIPAPPKSLVAPTTMHRSAHINKNRVSVRLGPGLDYRRVQYGYEGDLVTVTAEQDGWMQVAMENGHTGWVLSSLVATSKKSDVDEVASKGHHQPADDSNRPHKASHDVAMVAVDEEKNRTRKVARRRVSDATSARKHQRAEQHPTKSVAHSAKSGKTAHSKSARVAKASHESGKSRTIKHKHATEIALSSHRRKLKTSKSRSEQASARRHSSSEVSRVTRSSSRRQATQVADAGGHASSDLVRTAYAYRGTPYVWGGERPGGFDCSGLTRHLYSKKGIDLPHSARAQFEMGHKVDRHGLKPGDLVFFHTVTPGISHVGMYVGNGNFVHASSRRSGGVRVDSLDSSYYSKAYRGARRMK